MATEDQMQFIINEVTRLLDGREARLVEAEKVVGQCALLMVEATGLLAAALKDSGHPALGVHYHNLIDEKLGTLADFIAELRKREK